jgi:membrane carboxypeptidase/penicillin-binding protein
MHIHREAITHIYREAIISSGPMILTIIITRIKGMELSSIAYQHRDYQTDQLYRPLRQAIENYSSEKMQTLQQMQHSKASPNIFTSKVRRVNNSNTQIGQHRIVLLELFR